MATVSTRTSTHHPRTRILLLITALCTACVDKPTSLDADTVDHEGDAPGECSDGADNDRDGLFDCDDPGCTNAPVCDGDGDTPQLDSDPEFVGDAVLGGAQLLSDEVGTGGGDDGWRPSTSVQLDCAWLPQSPPGDWSNTLNCGPTSLLMAESCFDTISPNASDIIDLIHWMDGNIGSYSGPGTNNNGSYTNTGQLADTSFLRFGRTAERRSGATLGSVYDELVDGRPVIVTTLTQSGNNVPSDVMLMAGAPHFMLMVGMTPTHVLLHDPGRSQPSQAAYREFTIESFHQNWQHQGNASLFFTDQTQVDGQLTECTVTDAELLASGWVSADAGIERWSITVGSSAALHSESRPGTTDSFTTTVDVSDWADGGTHSAALWVLPQGAASGTRVDTCSFTVSSPCDADDYQDCYNGDVYWYDSCGVRGSRADDCNANQTCVDHGATATCETNVVANHHQDCFNGDPYWFDSSGNRGSRIDSCRTCESCVDAGQTASCAASLQDHQDCHNDDVYWFDSCNARGSIVDNCSSSEDCVDHGATATCETNVVANDHQDCFNGDPYWFDSAGNRGSRVDSCQSCETCVDAGQTASCASNPEDHQDCFNDDAYWFDSCNARGSIVDNCSSSEDCVDHGATATCETNVVANDHQDCFNGDPYWFDSAGNRGSRVDSCQSCESCVDAGQTASCASSTQDHQGCYNDDVYWFDSCGSRGSIEDNCSSSERCQDQGSSASCVPNATAVDETDHGDWCRGSSADIFRAGSISVSNSGSDPRVTATFSKCDGSPMSVDKSCHIRVGSFTGSGYSFSLDRHSFTWPGGRTTHRVSWDAWPSASSFSNDSVTTVKDFYVVCSEPTGDWNHWRSENAVSIVKR